MSIDWKGLRLLHWIHVTREDTREENNKDKDRVCVLCVDIEYFKRLEKSK